MPDRQGAVDAHILANRKILAVKALRQIHGYTLHEAVEDLNTRYLWLQQHRPQDFDPAPEPSS